MDTNDTKHQCRHGLPLAGPCEECDSAQCTTAGADADSVRVQRVGSLCARWRAEAHAMDKLADECDDLDEERDAAECRERARTFRECANDLERKWAGTEATNQAQR